MKIRTAFLAAAVVLSLSGCMKHTFVMGSGGGMQGSVVYNKWHAHFLFGLIGNKRVQVEEFCRSGNATVYERTSFINGLVSSLIGGIYSPTTVTIRCADGSRAELGLTKDEVARIVSDPIFIDWVADIAPERMGDVWTARQRLAQSGSYTETGIAVAGR